MGFSWLNFYYWLLNRGWLHPDHGYKPFMNSINGLTAGLLVKAYERTLEYQLEQVTEALDDLTKPFGDNLTMDDLAEHNERIRLQFDLK